MADEIESNTTTTAAANENPADNKLNVNIFFAIFLPCLSMAIVVGNVMIIVAFWKVPSLLDKASEYLILNLSIIDLLTGLLVLPVQSIVFIVPGYWPLGEIGCRLQAISLQTNMYAALFTLIAISTDRLLLVLKEYPVYLKMQSLPRIRIYIILIWLLAFSAAMVEQILWNPAKLLEQAAADIDFTKTCLTPPRRLRAYTLSVFLMVYFAPVIVVCILSTSFLVLLGKRLKKTSASPASGTASTALAPEPNSNEPIVPAPSVQPKSKPPSSRNRYIKPAVSLMAVVVSMAICMLPYCFYVMIINLICPTCNSPRKLFSLLLLQFCNACLDPLLYGMTHKKIRLFYHSFFARNIIRPL